MIINQINKFKNNINMKIFKFIVNLPEISQVTLLKYFRETQTKIY